MPFLTHGYPMVIPPLSKCYWLRPQRQARRRIVAGTCWAAASQAQTPGPSPPAPAPAQKYKSMGSWILEASDERCRDRLVFFVAEFCSLWNPGPTFGQVEA